MSQPTAYHTAQNLDKDTLEYIAWFALEYGGSFCKQVVERYSPKTGRCIVLVKEGVPLIDFREEVIGKTGEGWRFRAWSQGEPVPTAPNGEPLTLDGRIRWHKPNIDSLRPEEVWREIIRAFLNEMPGRIGLFYEYHGRASDTFSPEVEPDAKPFRIIRLGTDLYHLVSASESNEDIEFAWEAASELGGEGLGHLASLPKDIQLDSGDHVSRNLFTQLVANTVATAVQAFDGEGVLVWLHGVQAVPSWADEAR